MDKDLLLLRDRLSRIAAAGNTKGVLDPVVRDAARRLTAQLDEADTDPDARRLIGWFHWYRSQALPRNRGKKHHTAATKLFASHVITGQDIGDIPEALRPGIAEQALQVVCSMLIVWAPDDPFALSRLIELWPWQASSPNADGRTAIAGRLGIALQMRFETTGADLAEADGAVDVLRAALSILPTEDTRPYVEHYLAQALRTRFQREQADDDLGAAIMSFEAMLRLLPDDHPARVRSCKQLGVTHWMRFRHSGASRDLDGVIDHLGTALILATGPDPSRPYTEGMLGAALLARYENSGAPEDAVASIEWNQAAVDGLGEHDGARIDALVQIGKVLVARYENDGALDDLRAAVAVTRRVVDATPPDEDHRYWRLRDLEWLLIRLFKRTEDRADLEPLAAVHREALAAAPGNTERAFHLGCLREALLTRFQYGGPASDLDDAAGAARAALAADPAESSHLTELAAVLRERFSRRRDPADLAEAIDLCRTAVARTAPDGQEAPDLLTALGHALRTRAQYTGDFAEANEAVAVLARALVGDGPDDNHLELMALARVTRFQCGGPPADLDAAVALLRQALENRQEGGASLAGNLANLSNVLGLRFERTMDLSDLDAAIAAGRSAVDATPEGHISRVLHLGSLGNALRIRFNRTHDAADLNGAQDAFHSALGEADFEDPNLDVVLANMSIALGVQYEHDRDPETLEGAIVLLQGLVRLRRDQPELLAATLSNLGIALDLRFQLNRDPVDLSRAIAAIQEAVDAVPEDHHNRAMFLSNLASQLKTRYENYGSPDDRNRAIRVASEGAAADLAPPRWRISAARTAADLLAPEDPGAAADLLETAVRLLPEVAPFAHGRGDRQQALGEVSGLATDAAALALAVPEGPPGERAERALALLEAGRGVILGQGLDLRGDLAELQRDHPGLAARFTRLRARLEQLDNADERRATLTELRRTLKEIQSIAAFTSFGRPPSVSELLDQAAEGPIAVFNISAMRSDALLLTETGITTVALPELTLDVLTEQVKTFHEALRAIVVHHEDAPEPIAARERLRQILGWLWDAAAEPVLRELGYTAAPTDGEPWPRVWWMPTGLLSLLPLHAAGRHSERVSVLDRVVSSVTPTVRALAHARRHGPAPVARALIVTMPTTPGKEELLYATLEGDHVAERIPEHVRLSPDSEPPTKDSVLSHLPDCSIAHFACHSTTDFTDPSNSGLLLDGERLTVAALAPADLDDARLAYLSACRTALMGGGLADEAIHLSSAFQLAGFRHVVGSLWKVNDLAAVDIAGLFYDGLHNDCGNAARALHDALRDLRARQETRIEVWAAHQHLGA